MRDLCIFCLLLLMAAPALAQETTPDPDLLPLATQVAEQLAELQATAAYVEGLVDQASSDVDNAFSLLGLLEAFSFLVTVVGGAAAIFGVTRFIQAQNDLQEARERFEKEIHDSSQRLEKETTQRQQEFADLREALEKSTSNSTLALAFLPLGEGQYKSGDFNGALDIYHRALKLDSDNPIINYRLGYVYTQSGRLEEAEQYLQQALHIEPDFAPALATLGYVYRRRGEKMDESIDRVTILNKAEQNLVRALKISPKLVDEEGESWWGSLGGLYRRRGQIDQAIYAYNEAAKVMPNSSYAFSNLALLYMQKRDRDLMLETYEQVEKLAGNEVQADVDNYWAYTDLVTSRLALGKIQEAEHALESVFRTTPEDSPYVLEALHDTLSRLGDVMGGPEAEHVKAFEQRVADQIALKQVEVEESEPLAGD
jgi:tetratricopeptide (TPR) repeat protein